MLFCLREQTPLIERNVVNENNKSEPIASLTRSRNGLKITRSAPIASFTVFLLIINVDFI